MVLTYYPYAAHQPRCGPNRGWTECPRPLRSYGRSRPTLQPLGTSRDRRGDAAVGRAHTYDADDDRRPSRLTVLGVLSGRGALRGQDR